MSPKATTFSQLFLSLTLVAFSWETLAAQNTAGKGTFSIQTKSRSFTGSPLVWDKEKLFLLTGYGGFEELNFKEVKSFKKRSDARIVFSKNSFGKRLKAEFGDRYQISTTQDYLVVHPRSQGDFWPKKIQTVYTSFQNYFKARRISIRKRDYPLVALIFATRKEFDQYAQKRNEKIDRNIVGYYSPNSNRVAMYDQSKTGKTWTENFDTIVHEISHQAAFNCGIHGRFGDTPRWIVEGLGTMFEADGVWDSMRHPKQLDRINSGLLYLFNSKTLSSKKSGWVGNIVIGNRLFEKDPEVAYSTSWALTFYLMETKPHEFVRYMKKLSLLPAFEKYSQQQRLSDFEKAFGQVSRLESSLMQYYSKNINAKYKLN